MANEPEDFAPYEPGIAPRLAWWFGIYLAAQIPLIIQAFGNGYFLFVPFIFPWILGSILVPFISVLPDSIQPALVPFLFSAGYAFYMAHLYATLKAPTRRRFDFLLLILVIVVLANQWLLASQAASIHM